MLRVALTACVAFTLSGFQATASAAPIVASGSEYSIFLKTENLADQTLLTPIAFDGAAQSFVRSGLNLSVSESQAELGGGRHHLGVRVAASGDLFPAAGGAIMGVGQFGGGIDFVRPVRLVGAYIELWVGTSRLFRSSNYAVDYGLDPRVQFDPWNGQMLADNLVLIIGNAGNRGIDDVRFEFEVEEAPEPGTVLLLLTALPAAAFIRRRRPRP